MTAMLQVVFMAIGLAVLTFVIAFLFRKWQRAILWAVALLLFVGTLILLGAGVLKIYENGMMNHAVLLDITLAYACSFIFIYGAEKLHKALRQNCSTSETSIAQPVQVVDEELVQPESDLNALFQETALGQSSKFLHFNNSHFLSTSYSGRYNGGMREVSSCPTF